MSEMHITPEETAGAPEDCGGCSLHDAFTAPAAMERRQFFRAAGLAGQRNDKRYPVPVEDGVSIDKDNSVIIARASGKIYAFSLGCPHQNTALRWDADDHQFMCPKHKSATM